jgi:hypothetical protein
MNAEPWSSVKAVLKFKPSQIDECVRIAAVGAADDASRGVNK